MISNTSQQIQKSDFTFPANESETRIKLAAVYRLIDYFGWNDLTLTHASCRVPEQDSQLLINSISLYFDEITASNLVKMNFEGNIIGDYSVIVNPTGYIFHSAVLEARPDINAVIHAHTPYGVALSALECGLLFVDQTSMMFHDKIAYHDYSGLAMDEDEKVQLANDLGKEKSILIMRNHGLLVCGQTIEEAFVNLYFLESACRTQILAMSTGANLNQPESEVVNSFSQRFKQVNKDPKKPNLYQETFNSLIRELDNIDISYRY